MLNLFVSHSNYRQMSMNAQFLKMLFETAVFVAEQHQYQRRGGYDDLPYINHLLKVTHILIQCGESDPTLLKAALLHDVIEDTPITFEMLADRFGPAVAQIVQELTDDMDLPYDKRKQLQVERASELSLAARKIRIADKIGNIRDIFHYPVNWPLAKKVQYRENSKAIIREIRGTQLTLETLFEQTVEEIEQQFLK